MKFGSNGPKSASSTGVDTLIGRQTEVLGDIVFAGGLHVDGRIRGRVVAEAGKAASLSVSESGVIEGDVRVPIILLNGTIVGDVQASERVALASKAKVTGSVFYKIIEMEGGALVNGQLVHEANTAAIGEAAADELDELSEARRIKGLSGISNG